MGTVITSTYYVNDGQVLASPDIQGNGRVYVNVGGSATNAVIHDGGEELVLNGGTDMDASVSSGGIIHANTGRLFRTHVYDGGILNGFGAAIYSAVIGNGGTMAISAYVHQISGLVSRGHVESTVVETGGVMTLNKYAVCSNTKINGGTMFVSSGTEAYGITMTDGLIQIETGYAKDLTMSGGSTVIKGEGVLNPGLVENLTLSAGVAFVSAGGVVSGGKLYAGNVGVMSKGQLVDAVAKTDCVMFIGEGGEQYRGTVYGHETIAAGGTAINVTFNPDPSKYIYILGSAVNCNLAGGSARITSGGFFSGTANMAADAGLAEFVLFSGGTAKVNKVSGDRVHAIISGGSMDLAAGKVEWVYLKDAGGTFGLGSGAITGSADIVNGVMNVEGVLRNARVTSGGSVMISSGGVITGKFDITSGAIVTAAEGAIVDFDLCGVSAGQGAILSSLSKISGTPDYSLTVGENQAVGTYKLAGGAAGFSKTLTVKDSAGTELGTLAIGGDGVGYSGRMYALNLTDDTLTVTAVYGSSDTVFMGTVTGETKVIESGMTALGATVNEDGLMSILNKGKASNTLVNFGGEMVVSTGGKVQGVTIESGGKVSVLEDVMAKNVVVNGGTLVLDTYGWAYGTDAKGNTVSSNTIVKNGGQVIVHDNAWLVGAYVSDGGRVDIRSDGTFSAGRVSDAEVCASNGAYVARVTLENGGILNVESGGRLENITVNAGGVITGVLRDASQLSFHGGTLDLNISMAAPGSEFLVDEISFVMPPKADDYVCTLTVGDSQAKGTYQLIEGASSFDTAQTVTVVNISGEELGTLTLNASVAIGNDLYTLSQDAGDYSLLVTIADKPEPTPPSIATAKGDRDGNGVSDVMFVWTGEHGEGNHAHGYWMNGTSDWWSANAPGVSPDWDNLGSYDMSGDGKADAVMFGNVIVNDARGAYIGYYQDGNDMDDWVTIGFLDNAENVAWQNKVGNLTGNASGKNSIVWYAPDLYALGAWKDGTTEWVTLCNTFGSAEWTLVGCGDFDGDGKDSVLMSYNKGQLYYTVDLSGALPQSLGSSDWRGWEIRAIGDFAGDGKDDIVLFHEETGSMVMCADGNVDNYKSIGQLAAKDWFVVGAGDYDGDKQDDLLVRQYSTGMLGYYTSGIQDNWNVLGYGVDMNWTVIA